MRAIVPVRIPLVYKSQIGFVNKGSSLQRVALALSSQMARREPTEFPVNEWGEVIQGPFITVGPLSQQLCHVVGCRHVIENTAQLQELYARSNWPDSCPGYLKKKPLLMIDFSFVFRVCK